VLGDWIEAVKVSDYNFQAYDISLIYGNKRNKGNDIFPIDHFTFPPSFWKSLETVFGILKAAQLSPNDFILGRIYYESAASTFTRYQINRNGDRLNIITNFVQYSFKKIRNFI
jgi:hypothetical protein